MAGSTQSVPKCMGTSRKSAFIPFDDRLRLIYKVIKPGYAKIRESMDEA